MMTGAYSLISRLVSPADSLGWPLLQQSASGASFWRENEAASLVSSRRTQSLFPRPVLEQNGVPPFPPTLSPHLPPLGSPPLLPPHHRSPRKSTSLPFLLPAIETDAILRNTGPCLRVLEVRSSLLIFRTYWWSCVCSKSGSLTTGDPSVHTALGNDQFPSAARFFPIRAYHHWSMFTIAITSHAP